jgi:hypothetical protein
MHGRGICGTGEFLNGSPHEEDYLDGCYPDRSVMCAGAHSHQHRLFRTEELQCTSGGAAIGALMREKVLVPLGMTRTSMVWEPYFAADMANGYDEAGKSLGHNARRRPRAAGSVDSNLRDVALFARAVLRGDGLSAAARWEMCSFTWRLYP